MEVKGETAGTMKGSVKVQGEHEQELSWCGLKTCQEAVEELSEQAEGTGSRKVSRVHVC